jgi:hypothetical protein
VLPKNAVHDTMLLFGAAELVLVAPVALLLRSPPEITGGAISTAGCQPT